MKRVLLAFLLCLCVGLAAAQTSSPQTAPANAPKKQAEKQESGFMGWVHGAWKTVQDQGRAGADRIAKEWPNRLKQVKNGVAVRSKKIHDTINSMNLEQKRDMLVELWSLRKSLDIMALLNPETLHALTGIDASGLKSLETQVASMTTLVTRKIHGG